MSELLESLKKSKILFYPGAGMDFTPLECLADLCDTFVFCDWQVDEDVVRDRVGGLDLPGYAEPEITTLTVNDLCPDGIASADPAVLSSAEQDAYSETYDIVRPWGRGMMATFPCQTSDRSLRLIYLGAEGVDTYWRLFTANGIRPEAIALIHANNNWTDFEGWTEPLARVARANKAGLPKYLVTAHVGKLEKDYEVFTRVLDELAVQDTDAATTTADVSLSDLAPDNDEFLDDNDEFWPRGGHWPYYTVFREIAEWNGRDHVYVLQR